MRRQRFWPTDVPSLSATAWNACSVSGKRSGVAAELRAHPGLARVALRPKLNRDGDAGYVLNVWGVGYRLTALS